ncbi:metallophosphoesterase family protein [Clostridium fungisolvens]|uniref:3',5'-cyclic adenosine monophosphate phosphodiesterase CpdA n=1 Tax=Clostridium fungisolvens TaxID=1604897 RepID=A0A6V8SHD2_9CLOT|nr:metallophosphoesterase [Clostridium fungisolvens]GFP76619.1 3',5'-cyclic adenosine monophosphate phosphodiesterase CpdA [Clostridium fungisolvens]
MKKIRIIVVAIILIIAGVIVTEYVNENKHTDKTAVAPVSNADLAFAVLGDVHDDIEHFQGAIDDLNTINSNMDALVLNGDTVGQGIEAQYASMKKTLNENKNLIPKTIIENIGNHEFFDYNIKVNSPEQVQTFINRYLEFSGQKKVYHDAWVKNYHFISLGSEDGNSKTLDSVSAYISDVQLNWFKEKIGENYQKGKPIFVFLHQPLDSGNKNWASVNQSKQIKEILSKYPEAILFTSHTHRDLVESSVVVDQPFTMIHTGAVYYTVIPDANSKGGRKNLPYIKGLYIEVNGNKVVVKGRDMKEKKWIFTKEINKS